MPSQISQTQICEVAQRYTGKQRELLFLQTNANHNYWNAAMKGIVSQSPMAIYLVLCFMHDHDLYKSSILSDHFISKKGLGVSQIKRISLSWKSCVGLLLVSCQVKSLCLAQNHINKPTKNQNVSLHSGSARKHRLGREFCTKRTIILENAHSIWL